MARKQLTEQEREQIRNSIKETRLRRKIQILKVFEIKVNCHQIKKETFDKMKNYFIQAKWIYNDRDIHAAKNVKLFGSTQRAECLEQTSDSFLDKTKNVNEKEAITL